MVFHLFEWEKQKQINCENKLNRNNEILPNNCNLMLNSMETNKIDRNLCNTMDEKLMSGSISSSSQCINQIKNPLSMVNNDSNANQNHQQKRVASGCSIYILFTLLFICICTTSVLLMVHINRVTDIERIRDGLKAEFLSKSDVHALVQDILNELRHEEEARSWNQR